jgi:hypothetical protein
VSKPTAEDRARWAANEASDQRRAKIEAPAVQLVMGVLEQQGWECSEAASVYGLGGGHDGTGFTVTINGQEFYVQVEAAGEQHE